MKRTTYAGIIAVCCLTLALAGCPDPKTAVVFNGSSDNISSVDLATGTVTPDLGGISIGPLANRAVLQGTTAYVVNSGGFPGSTNASVMKIDLATNTLVDTIPFPDGANPWAIALVNPNKAYVTTLYGNNVTILDLTRTGAAAIVGTIPLPTIDGVPAGPAGIVVHEGYAYTANTGYDAASWGYVTGSVSVIHTATDTIVDVDNDPANGTDTPVFTTQINPQDLDVGTNGNLYVACTGDYWSQWGVVDVIDPATWTVTDSIAVGGSPGNLTVSGGYALLGAGNAAGCDLYAIKTADNSAVYDSSTPLTLMPTSGWCTVGKIEAGMTSRGWKAFVPAGAWGAENALFQVGLAAVPFEKTFDLVPGANLPAAVGLIY